MTTETLPVLAILGGKGELGTGLARRWAKAGYPVIIGSRTAEKSKVALAKLQTVMTERGVSDINVQHWKIWRLHKPRVCVGLTAV